MDGLKDQNQCEEVLVARPLKTVKTGEPMTQLRVWREFQQKAPSDKAKSRERAAELYKTVIEPMLLPNERYMIIRVLGEIFFLRKSRTTFDDVCLAIERRLTASQAL